MIYMSSRQEWLPVCWGTGRSAEVALPDRSRPLEEEGYGRGYKSVAGLDEVGRGPLAGPVVAAAVILPRKPYHPGIRDSKLLTRKKRENLSVWIKENSLTWGVGIVEPAEIDQINILQASLLAMAYAMKKLDPFPDYLLIDGIHEIPLAFLMAEGKRAAEDGGWRVEDRSSIFDPRSSGLPAQRAVKHGDRLCLSVAAASIVAKVARDEIMMEYDRLYPGYGFAAHKGYGSQAHLAALSRYGPSAIHRRSFRPVRESADSASKDQPEESHQRSAVSLRKGGED